MNVSRTHSYSSVLSELLELLDSLSLGTAPAGRPTSELRLAHIRDVRAQWSRARELVGTIAEMVSDDFDAAIPAGLVTP